MAVPEIKTPAAGTPLYTHQQYLIDKKLGINQDSFGYVFYDTYDKKFDETYNSVMRYKQRMAKEDITGYEISKITNEFEESMRRSIDNVLQKHLLEKNSVISQWPLGVMSFELVKKTTTRTYNDIDEEFDKETFESGRYTIWYDHFGTECIPDPKNYKECVRKDGGRKYRYSRYYQFDEYEKVKTEEYSLRKDMEAAKKNPIEKIKLLISALPAVLLILTDIVLIFGAIFGISAIRETIGPHIPFYMSLSSIEGYSALHFFSMPIIGSIVTYFLYCVLEPKVEDVGSYKEQKKKYFDYINSPKYKSYSTTGNQNEKSYNIQAQRWYKEWFEATSAIVEHKHI